ncbi:amidohydrolase family protein [Tessaracoccus coleopterorum]
MTAIKIAATAGVSDAKEVGYAGKPEMPEESMRAICREAHEAGILVAAHAQSAEGVAAALRAGVDTIEHGSAMNEEVIGLFLDNPASLRGSSALIPTLQVALPLVKLPIEDTGADPIVKANAELIVEEMRAGIRTALEHGIPVGVGTDSAVSFVTHSNFWRELDLLERYANLSSGKVLNAATQVNAQILGLEEVTGSIAPGLSADLVVVEQNPLKTFRNLSEPWMVVARANGSRALRSIGSRRSTGYWTASEPPTSDAWFDLRVSSVGVAPPVSHHPATLPAGRPVPVVAPLGGDLQRELPAESGPGCGRVDLVDARALGDLEPRRSRPPPAEGILDQPHPHRHAVDQAGAGAQPVRWTGPPEPGDHLLHGPGPLHRGTLLLPPAGERTARRSGRGRPHWHTRCRKRQGRGSAPGRGRRSSLRAGAVGGPAALPGASQRSSGPDRTGRLRRARKRERPAIGGAFLGVAGRQPAVRAGSVFGLNDGRVASYAAMASACCSVTEMSSSPFSRRCFV